MRKQTNLGAHFHCVFNLKYHLVLVTKYRHKIFTNEMLIELEAKTRELSDKWGVSILEFNGEKDHVHLIIDMNPSVQPSKFIGNLKTVTSRHMRKVYGEYLRQFYSETNAMWARAYCLISVEGAPISVLREYIDSPDRLL